MKIILVGGGTAGSVSPLLAVREYILKQYPQAQFVFVGSRFGVERQMAETAAINYKAIPAAKWRRYISWKNLFTPFILFTAFFSAASLLLKFRPNCVFGAGSFLQVPVMWAAWVLRIPVVIHQQDILPSLSNTLCAPIAKKVTVTFESSVSGFSEGITPGSLARTDKIVWTGNPTVVAKTNANREEVLTEFGLDPSLPTLLVTGGGTGAVFLNELIWRVLPELTATVNVIHSTGLGKNSVSSTSRYYVKEFINDMSTVYAVSDIVLSRAGLSTITELSYLGKLAIIIPLPNGHQLANAKYLHDKLAAIVFEQKEVTGVGLVKVLRNLLFKKELQDELPKNISQIMPHNSAKAIGDILIKICK